MQFSVAHSIRIEVQNDLGCCGRAVSGRILSTGSSAGHFKVDLLIFQTTFQEKIYFPCMNVSRTNFMYSISI